MFASTPHTILERSPRPLNMSPTQAGRALLSQHWWVASILNLMMLSTMSPKVSSAFWMLVLMRYLCQLMSWGSYSKFNQVSVLIISLQNKFYEWCNNLKISPTKSLLVACIRCSFTINIKFSMKFDMEDGFWMLLGSFYVCFIFYVMKKWI